MICNDHIQNFDRFEIIVLLLKNLEDSHIISINKNILSTISNYFKKNNFELAFSNMKYIIKKINKFSRNEVDFYYIITSLNTMFNLDVQFEEKFILNPETRLSPFYPNKIRGLEIKEEEEKIYIINEFDINYKNKYGVYFIYNHQKELVYIGKSTTCLMSRAFKSAEERKTLNFSKIELRECKKCLSS